MKIETLDQEQLWKLVVKISNEERAKSLEIVRLLAEYIIDCLVKKETSSYRGLLEALKDKIAYGEGCDCHLLGLNNTLSDFLDAQ